MIDYYELIIGSIMLVLSLFIESKSIIAPLSVFSFVILGLIPDVELLLRISVTLNVFCIAYIMESGSGRTIHDAYDKIINKNKKYFPFHENVRIAITKHPYTYLYLKEGKVLRLRCSLTELLDVVTYLTKVSRNSAIAEGVEYRGDRFIIEDQEIPFQMLLSWGRNSSR